MSNSKLETGSVITGAGMACLFILGSACYARAQYYKGRLSARKEMVEELTAIIKESPHGEESKEEEA